MSNLIGLAFTSPGMAILAIDRTIYRVYYHDQTTLTDFRLFLEQQDKRIPVVFVKSIRDLAALQPIGEGIVKSYLLFEDAEVLWNIEGALLPDLKEDLVTKWEKIRITPKELNDLILSNNKPFKLTEKALKESSKMIDPITFKELLNAVENVYKEKKQDPTNLIVLACKYISKTISKKIWITSGRKPALELGVPIKVIAELEKNIETSKTSDEVWRAVYEYSTKSTDLLTLVTKYAVSKEDIEFIIEKAGITQDDTTVFQSVPGKSKRKASK